VRLSKKPQTGARAAAYDQRWVVERQVGDRLRLEFTVDQLVHDYGDVCQAITELVGDLNTPISTDDCRTLNKCLDYAIARAVTIRTPARTAAAGP
jgi:hypothetical protein